MVLDSFIAANRDEIITRCEAKGAIRSLLVPAPPSIDDEHGVPLFLHQVIDALRLGQSSNPEIGLGALHHGHELLQKGFTVSQVVHAYGDVCQAVTELAVESDAVISASDFGTLNRCLDEAIAGAVTEYGRERDRSTSDVTVAPDSEQLGLFAHELRNLVNTAILAFEVLKAGNAGVGGSTGAVLQRSLVALRALVGQSLGQVRVVRGIQRRDRILVAGFIEELAAAAVLDADARGLQFTVLPVDERVAIEADRQVLAAVIGNLLQNAFKFTRPHSAVTLRVQASASRVLIEIEDECGGLPGGDPDELFHAFEQRGDDRSGLGLGLAFSRWAVEANHGRIHARSLPGKGCVFTVDLARIAVSGDALA